MTSFDKRVLEILSTIPRGRVVTYKDVAKLAGAPRAYRAVGNAVGKNPFAPKVPCHRVIASDGTLGGYSGGLPKKIKLLRAEGVEIRNNRIDLGKYQWGNVIS